MTGADGVEDEAGCEGCEGCDELGGAEEGGEDPGSEDAVEEGAVGVLLSDW